ncbi:membrane protein insertion efficiency factor YidD [Kitasatospora misakiensis]|uniref:Membrane protein insertion efficiency factor YidD n=1 Tax=Kitasatospora misakiensis TaxID=67330 RepID=A0ABW0X5M9_9ACTN
MAHQQPGQGEQFPTTTRPGRAWWWLPAEERRRRKRRQQEWKAYLRRHGERKKDSDFDDYLPSGCGNGGRGGNGGGGGGCGGGGNGGCGGGGGGCDGPCLLALLPVMTVAGLRFALTGVRGGQGGRGGGRTRSAEHGTDPAAPPPRGLAAAVLYGAVHHYRTEISPKRPACCLYTPSCSTYAVQALHRHGAVRGARLTAGRLLRCRPAAARRRNGVDPVPER